MPIPQPSQMLDFSGLHIFVGRNGLLYRAWFDADGNGEWDVAEVRLEWWRQEYPPYRGF